jgi:hypothetical protein
MSSQRNYQKLIWIAFILPFFMIVLLAIHNGPDHDFKVFYAAGDAVLHLHKPLLWNPPWIALLFAPLALLPIQIAYVFYVCLSILGFALALHRLGCKPISILTIMLSAVGVIIIGNGNIDWLVLLGVTIPPQYGLFLMVAKPQMTIMLVIILFIKALYQLVHKDPRPFLQFVPITIVTLLTFSLDLWRAPNLKLVGNTLEHFFPNGIPIGLYLAYHAWKENRTDLALAASPFMVPYANACSLVVFFLPLKDHQRLLALASMFAWALVILWIKTS